MALPELSPSIRSSKKKVLLIASGVVLLAGLLVGGYFWQTNHTKKNTAQQTQEATQATMPALEEEIQAAFDSPEAKTAEDIMRSFDSL